MSALKFSVSAARARHGQRGQALVFVTVTILIMVIAVFMTYNVGQLTNQKTRLQNTADAAAYSAALAQARDYNFSAYMNRAMIANDVSVAQQLALRSWVRAFEEAFKDGGLLSKYAPPRRLDPAKGPLYGIWDLAETGARTAANLLNGALDTFTPLYVNAVYYVNNILALSQKVYHYSTSITVAQTTGWIEGLGDKLGALTGLSFLGDISSKFNEALSLGVDSNVISKNDPNAQLSELGLLAFVYDTKQWLAFTENRNPVGPWGQEFERKNRTDTRRRCSIASEAQQWRYYNLFWYNWVDGDMSGYCPSYNDPPFDWVIYDVNGAWIDVDYTVPDNASRDYTIAPLRDSTPDNLFREYDGPRKDRYSNIVVDMLDEFTTNRNAEWKFPIGLPYGFVDLVATIGGWAPLIPANVWLYKNVTHESEGLKLWNDEKHDTNVGASLGYKKRGSWNRRWKTSDTVDLEGAGSAPTPPPPPFPWSFRFPIPVPGPPFINKEPPGFLPYKSASSKLSTGDATGSTKYTASNAFGEHVSDNDIFRKYRDVTNIEQGTATANQNWTSPPLLIEVERSTRTIWTSDQSLKASAYSTTKGCTREASVPGKRVEAVFGEGNFQLGDGASSNCMRAMAKAEAYFSRPSDLFARADNKTEYGSLYSPYWQARLVKTTPTDQALSMAFHYCDGKGNVLACVGAVMDSAKQETKSLWNTLTNLRSYLN